MTGVWNKSDWRKKPRVQMPDYPDQDALRAVEAQLSKYPPLVFAGESRRLRAELAKASRGEAFLLQGGDRDVIRDYISWRQTPRSLGYLERLAAHEARTGREVVPY